MSAIETFGVMGGVDEEGKQFIHYPITKADLVDYDNRASGLLSDNAKDAIDELAARTYRVILADRVTNARYELIVEDGKLRLMETAPTVGAGTVTLIDQSTGLAYALAVESGRLEIKEV